MNQSQKRIAVIHSLAGFGKCSMTIILPVLAAVGLEVCPLPTSVLSSHTGGLPGLHRRDLTDDLLPTARQWKNLNLHFDCIYSGYLGSLEQVSLVSEIFDLLADQDTLKIVDPCMADNGRLYSSYSPEAAKQIGALCRKADLILPNLTEASFLLDEPYRPGDGGNPARIDALLHRLISCSGKGALLTGVTRGEAQIGSACLSSAKGTVSYALAKQLPGHHHGAGDLFASVLIGGLMKGRNLEESALLAARFVSESIERTNLSGLDERYGIRFEDGLRGLMEQLQIKE